MPALPYNPHDLVSPDFRSDPYSTSRRDYITKNANATEEEAANALAALWKSTNDAEIIVWDKEVATETAAAADAARLEKEAEEAAAATAIQEREAARREEMKKNKAKYAPILPRGVPTTLPVIPSAYATKKIVAGAYFELYYFTNDGIEDARKRAATSDNDTLTFVTTDGLPTFVPVGSSKESRSSVREDKDLSWDDLEIALPRALVAMEAANWPEARVKMFRAFWTAILTHSYRSESDNDGLYRKALLRYQDEIRRSWHLAMASGNISATFDLTEINERLLEKMYDRIYDEWRRGRDTARLDNVRVFLLACVPVLIIFHLPLPDCFISHCPNVCFCHRMPSVATESAESSSS